MTMMSENVEADMRERILAVAAGLFREIGYQKTTVADIARLLRMSPANVYRFFDSKKSIHKGVARGLMSEVEDAAQAAMCACTAMTRFFHPQMIAQCASKPGPSIDQMIDFVLAGLMPRKATGQSLGY